MAELTTVLKGRQFLSFREDRCLRKKVEFTSSNWNFGLQLTFLQNVPFQTFH